MKNIWRSLRCSIFHKWIIYIDAEFGEIFYLCPKCGEWKVVKKMTNKMVDALRIKIK
jgi:hypothetical protein